MRKILCLLACLGLLSSCEKRYEEGPCLSFITAENRLCGDWTLHQYLVEENPAEGAFADTMAMYHFVFNMNSSKAIFLSLKQPEGITIAESLVRPDERMTSLSFSLSPITGYVDQAAPLFRLVPALENDQAWEITRLKRKELWMQTRFQNLTYQLKFELAVDYQSL